MSKPYPSERISGLLALVLCILFFGSAGLLTAFLTRRAAADLRPAAGLKAVHLNFARIELKSAEPPPPEPLHPEAAAEPEPDPTADEPVLPEPVAEPEPAPAEEIRPEQEASSPEIPVVTDAPLAGDTVSEDLRALAIAKVLALVEQEKYYPEAARRAGHRGRFLAVIRLTADGRIAGYSIEERRGHPLLGRAVETALGRIQGQGTGIQLPEALDVPLTIEFELN